MNFAKQAKSGLVFGRIVSYVLCLAFTSVAFATISSGWHGLSQSQRDSRIVSRANADVNHNAGVQCKEWVQRVVRDASQNVVTIPSTRPNNYEWNNSSDVLSYPRACPIPGIAPGHIIQMVWRNPNNGHLIPHTAIVTGSTSSGMTWIDCNWNNDCMVRTHTITYSQFNSCVGSQYTVYEIK